MTNFLHRNDLPATIDFGASVAIDTETMGLKTNRDRLCLLQISAGNGDAHIVQFEQNHYEAPNLRKILSNPEVLKIFHYARFDIVAINRYMGIELQNIYCTKIASRLVRTYTESHGLKSLCDELLGVEMSKKQQSSYWGTLELSKAQIDYAASDVLHLHKLKLKLDTMLIRENKMDLFKSCLNFLPTRAKLDLMSFDDLDIFAH